MKKCQNCGQPLAPGITTCPACGALQTSQITDLTVQPPVFNAGGTDLMPTHINAYRQVLGFNGDVPHVYGYFQDNVAVAKFGVYGVLSQKYFAVSLEPAGLLVMGLDVHTHFTGTNAYIPFDQMTSLRMRNYGVTYALSLTTAQGQLKMNIGKFIVRQPWQRTNAKLMANTLKQIQLHP